MTAVSRLLLLALLAFAPVRESSAEPDGLPGILGADDRVPRDAVDWPWAAIGRLNRATGGFCTATLIGPRHVLTAAHCLFDRRMRRILPDDIHFVAGYRRGDYLAHSVARNLILPETYRPEAAAQPEALANDWAVVVLRKPIDIRPIPVRAFAAGESATADGTLLRAGYSQDRAHLLSVHDGCEVAGSDMAGRLLLHTCDATRGDSGSPLLLRRADGLVILGINIGTVRSEGAEHGLAVPAAAFEATLRAALAADGAAAERQGVDDAPNRGDGPVLR